MTYPTQGVPKKSFKQASLANQEKNKTSEFIKASKKSDPKMKSAGTQEEGQLRMAPRRSKGNVESERSVEAQKPSIQQAQSDVSSAAPAAVGTRTDVTGKFATTQPSDSQAPDAKNPASGDTKYPKPAGAEPTTEEKIADSGILSKAIGAATDKAGSFFMTGDRPRSEEQQKQATQQQHQGQTPVPQSG
jgi:hypothetical protein